jgi:large subunit ribosomal protein L3
MTKGLIGRKIGMTQVFLEDGTCEPVTVISAGPCVVVQRKTAERDGYEAAQLGLIDSRPLRKPTKAMTGHFKNAGVPATRETREFEIAEGADPKPGDTVTCELFKAGDIVQLVGTSKGRGFQGVIKRHHYHGGGAAHGSMFHRAPGSLGQSSDPSRVYPGTRLPGHMGTARITVKGVTVVKVDAERNLLLVRGGVPGALGSLVVIESPPTGAPKKRK